MAKIMTVDEAYEAVVDGVMGISEFRRWVDENAIADWDDGYKAGFEAGCYAGPFGNHLTNTD